MPVQKRKASGKSASARQTASADAAARQVCKLVASLHTYQEELQAQNEQLLESQKELQESLDRYAGLYDNAPVGYMTLDRNGVIEEVNLSAVSMLNTDRDHVLKRPLLVFVCKEDREAFIGHMLRCRMSGTPTRVELRLHRRDGKMVPVELVGVPARRAKLGGVQYLTTIIDISDRLRLEQERLHAQEQRREAIIREQAARVANEAKDRFLAVLSHELRTPLTPVLAAVAALESLDLPDEARPMLKMVQRSVDIEARLIDDLLDVTRITRSKLRLHCDVVDVHELVQDTLSILQTGLNLRKISVNQKLDASRHHVQADASRLRQVLWNLLSNAIKFSPEGGSITIQTRSGKSGAGGSPNTPMLMIEVSDAGVGIPEEVLPNLFRAFEQGEAAGAGLGLGLAICKGLVEAHGGAIRALSGGRGKGATFVVQLPLVHAPVARRLSSQQPEAAAPPVDGAKPAEPLHILLVEDHLDTASVMSRLLQREGYNVTVANSKAEALAKAANPLDMVISDIGLPDGTGLELMREIRARHRVRGIALSGFGSDSDIEHSHDAGFNEHLIKPVNFAHLRETIKRLATGLPA